MRTAAERQKFRDAVTQLQAAAQKYEEGSDERKQIDAILAKIGTEGDGNNVRVAFDSKMSVFGMAIPQTKLGIPTGNILLKLNFGATEGR